MERRTFLTMLAGSVPTVSALSVATGASAARAVAASGGTTGWAGSGPPTTPFDLDTGNAAVEVVVPAIVPMIFDTMSPAGNDATLVLRATTMLTNAWFDAIAPYHSTAVGVCSRLDRRPAPEATDRARNIALLHASGQVLDSLFPSRVAQWKELVMANVASAPTAADEIAAGIGDAAGRAVVAARVHDGMNQLGDDGGHRYHQQPYADTTGYASRNTPDELSDPSRWQPLLVADRVGIFRAQRFVTPQIATTRPYSYVDPSEFMVDAPAASEDPDSEEYRAQADRVLAVSAGLTDEQKMTAELYDNKIQGLGFSALYAAQSHGLDVAGFVEFDFLTNLAAFDAAIAVWHAKAQYDAVRPTSVIRWLYGDHDVTAWGGPGHGRVTDLPGSQWCSYLATADHPEYPSGSTALCHAHAESSRRYFGSDDLDWSIPIPQGSSHVEPGVTPVDDLTLHFDTWSDLADACGNSRVWGGVHFEASVVAGAAIGRQIGERAAQFLDDHLAGTAPPPD